MPIFSLNGQLHHYVATEPTYFSGSFLIVCLSSALSSSFSNYELRLSSFQCPIVKFDFLVRHVVCPY